jgi:dephospho-CoA kinase
VRVIGLTGGIGVGKSEVSAALAKLGAHVIDADHEGHQTYARGAFGWRRIMEMFGDAVLTDDQEIDRRKLGELVFGNSQAMAWLNAAIHPLIRARLKIRLEELSSQGAQVAVIDAALLYEAGWDDLADEVWLVRAPAEAVIQRLAAQRGLQDGEVERRIDAQEPPKRAAARADVIIDNTGNLLELQGTVERLWTERIDPSRGSTKHD